MIYATKRDALLGTRLSSTAMWHQCGPTAGREVTVYQVEIGAALPTLVIHQDNANMVLGTSINSATPLLHQYAAKPVDETLQLATTAEMVEAIRSAFNLNITQLAGVLRIERVTVYAWLRTEGVDKLHPSNRDRLQALFNLAKEWRRYTPLAGRYIVEVVPGMEKTLLELLNGDDLSPALFSTAYERLARATGTAARVLRHRAEQKIELKKATENLLENAGKLGMDLS